MRITESRLRRIIRSVIKEGIDKTLSGTIDCVTGSGDLYQNLCSFLKKKLAHRGPYAAADDDTIKVDFDARELGQVCMLDSDRGRGEDALYDNEEIMCEFEIKSGRNIQHFISTDDNCKSFSIQAEVQDNDSHNYSYGDLVLYLKEYKQ